MHQQYSIDIMFECMTSDEQNDPSRNGGWKMPLGLPIQLPQMKHDWHIRKAQHQQRSSTRGLGGGIVNCCTISLPGEAATL